MKTIINTFQNFQGFIALFGAILDSLRKNHLHILDSELVIEIAIYTRRCMVYALVTALIVSFMMYKAYTNTLTEEMVPLLSGVILTAVFPIVAVLISILKVGIRNTSMIMQLEQIRHNFSSNGHSYSKLDSDEAFLKEMSHAVIASIVSAVLVYFTIVVAYQLFFSVLLYLNHDVFSTGSILLESTTDSKIFLMCLRVSLISLATSIIALYHGISHMKFSRAVSLSITDQVAVAFFLQLFFELL